MSSDFLIIRPLAITDAMLTSSTVPEAVAATYAGGTTYGAGDLAGLAPVYGDPQLVYASQSAGNVGNALPVPPATSTAFWKLVGSVYPPFASGSSCGVGKIVSSISANVHLLYESLVGGNTGNALTDTTKWLPLGATNRHKMFDSSYSSQTTNADTIVLVVAPGEIVNTLSLLNVEGASVTVAQSVSGYSHTMSLNSHQVNNWYDWYYEPVLRTGDVIISDIPPYASGVLTITIDNTGDTARLGCCILGKSRKIGTSGEGLSRSINDFSRTTEDSWGNVTLTPGTYSKRLTLPVKIDSGFESEAARLLEMYRATPLVFVASDEVAMTIIYGFLGAWDVPMASTGRPASIEIKGLT
jgi:hypothetical protein